jgi:hypothetical protein
LRAMRMRSGAARSRPENRSRGAYAESNAGEERRELQRGELATCIVEKEKSLLEPPSDEQRATRGS